ncbi:MAG: hypothetical protein ACOC8K_02650 [Gemmatimonadota bacterium]
MRGLGLPVALLLANGLLLGPAWILQGAPGPPWLAGEALLAVTVFLLLPVRRWTGFVAGGGATVLVASSVLLLGDAAARASLSRPMNLYLDWHLLDAVWKLMAGAVGAVPAALGLIFFLGTAGLAGWGVAHLLVRGRVEGRLSRVRLAVGGTLAVLLLVLSGWNGLWTALASDGGDGGDGEASGGIPLPALGRVVSWPTVSLATDQVRGVGALLEERARFSRELEETPSSHAHVPDLLGRLEGRNVVLAFIESYGMTVLREPRYADVLRPRLEEMGRRMKKAGLALATGSLVAPTQGGQSWFSHGSLLSGLWLDDQLKYDVLLTTRRETLVDDFSRAGYETVALMPAITLAWPEGEWFGYDEIYDFNDIDYAGPPLNWVTMPDQFTWSFLQHRILSPDGSDVRTGDREGARSLPGDSHFADPASGGIHGRRRSVFAEVGLISSHAPWTPILPVLSDWGSIGDGSIFAPWENAGERPDELWRDTERVRDHFALSVDYAVHAMTAYAEQYVDEETLLIVLGDHQPAPLITGEEDDRGVPVHVVSGDPDLVEPFVAWGFRRGALPGMERDAPGMDAFREWFVDAYSGPTGGRRAPDPREAS